MISLSTTIFECLLCARQKSSTADRVVNKKDAHSSSVRSTAALGALSSSIAATMYYNLVLVLLLLLSLLLLLGAYYVPDRILKALSLSLSLYIYILRQGISLSSCYR